MKLFFYKYKLSILLLAVFLLPNFAFAQVGLCSSVGYSIFTINGINTNKDDALDNKDTLQRKLFISEYKNEPLSVDFLYNPTHGKIIDLLDSGNQRYAEKDLSDIQDADFGQIFKDASAKVITQKLLLIGHSQGNFYANTLYNAVVEESGGVPAQSIGVYAVATPANHISGVNNPDQTNYTTSYTDNIIFPLKDRLTPNVRINFKPSDGDSNGHSFSKIYLAYEGDKIISNIQTSLNKLINNNIQKQDAPCISPPKLTLTQKVQGNILAFVDHPINTTKNATYNTGLAIGNKVIQIASNVYSVAKSLAGKTPNNAATVILANNQTSTDLSTSQVDKSVPKEPAKEKPSTPKKVGVPTSENIGTETLPIVENTQAMPAYTEETSPYMPILNENEDTNTTDIVSEPVVPNYILSYGSGGYGGGVVSIPEPPPSDTTPPIITLVGTDPVSVDSGSVYTDLGATASDDVDGDITANIIIVNPVNTATVGTYTITYNISDANGNAATQITRTVNVVSPPDTTLPIISSLTLSPNSGSVGVGGTVTLTIVADGADYTAGAITVNGVATTDFTNAGGNTYTATYTVASGNTNRSAGSVPVSVVLTDAALNSNVAYTTVGANTLAIVIPVVLYDSRDAFPYIPPPSPLSLGANNAFLWEREYGGAPFGGTIRTINTVLVTKNAFNTSGTFQLLCKINQGYGYSTAAQSTIFNTDDYLINSSSFEFSPYGVDVWKYADITFVNPFGDDCVFHSGDGVYIKITDDSNVYYIGVITPTPIPRNRIYITD